MGILVKHYKDPYKQPDIVEIQRNTSEDHFEECGTKDFRWLLINEGMLFPLSDILYRSNLKLIW